METRIIILIFILLVFLFIVYWIYKKKAKRKLINQIIQNISHFKSFREYGEEFPYQIDLARYLKHYFHSTEIEVQRGSSRPDIVIDNIAIEIKGPTNNEDLRTLADKCMRYLQHFNKLIIVLFEVCVTDEFYSDWEKILKKTFPEVILIKK